jgi:hypothetical protein
MTLFKVNPLSEPSFTQVSSHTYSCMQIWQSSHDSPRYLDVSPFYSNPKSCEKSCMNWELMVNVIGNLRLV